jgi:GNAT superfamily N-acetyltransferase
MNTMTIYKKIDSYNVAVLELLTPIEHKPKIRLISRIQIPEEFRGKGIGTYLMDTICQIADRQDYVMYIHLFQIQKRSRKRFISFLNKYNFYIAYVAPDIMFRLPGGKDSLPIVEEVLEIKKYLEEE